MSKPKLQYCLYCPASNEVRKTFPTKKSMLAYKVYLESLPLDEELFDWLHLEEGRTKNGQWAE